MIDKIDKNYYLPNGIYKREIGKEEIVDKINEMIEQINKLTKMIEGE